MERITPESAKRRAMAALVVAWMMNDVKTSPPKSIEDVHMAMVHVWAKTRLDCLHA
jgi:hypothetical protein